VPVHDLWATLMTQRLGYDRFMAQGGFYPRHIRAISLQAVDDPNLDEHSAPLAQDEQRHLAQRAAWSRAEGAYSAQQRTKPQTLSYGLNDSPAGLAAWIVEKFRRWSDCDGNVETRFTKDHLLTNIMLYWLTESIGPSVRYYHEWAKHDADLSPDSRTRVTTPAGVTVFPKDLSMPPREWAERTYNVQRYTVMPRGGHFAAHEEPFLLAGELRRLREMCA
jgi:pimeloyl-ACP methyl ester carboxylesterase